MIVDALAGASFAKAGATVSLNRIGQLAAEDAEQPIILDEDPSVAFVLDGFKVEGLAEPVLKGSAFSVATDDEMFGGAWRPVGEGLKKGKKGLEGIIDWFFF